jgi:hypothetical protein
VGTPSIQKIERPFIPDDRKEKVNGAHLHEQESGSGDPLQCAYKDSHISFVSPEWPAVAGVFQGGWYPSVQYRETEQAFRFSGQIVFAHSQFAFF